MYGAVVGKVSSTAAPGGQAIACTGAPDGERRAELRVSVEVPMRLCFVFAAFAIATVDFDDEIESGHPDSCVE